MSQDFLFRVIPYSLTLNPEASISRSQFFSSSEHFQKLAISESSPFLVASIASKQGRRSFVMISHS